MMRFYKLHVCTRVVINAEGGFAISRRGRFRRL